MTKVGGEGKGVWGGGMRRVVVVRLGLEFGPNDFVSKIAS